VELFEQFACVQEATAHISQTRSQDYARGHRMTASSCITVLMSKAVECPSSAG